jgi:hypothetical protein
MSSRHSQTVPSNVWVLKIRRARLNRPVVDLSHALMSSWRIRQPIPRIPAAATIISIPVAGSGTGAAAAMAGMLPNCRCNVRKSPPSESPLASASPVVCVVPVPKLLRHRARSSPSTLPSSSKSASNAGATATTTLVDLYSICQTAPLSAGNCAGSVVNCPVLSAKLLQGAIASAGPPRPHLTNGSL